MPSCSVKWCGKSSRTSNFKKDGITFHRFPKCPTFKEKWINATHRGEKWFPLKTSIICSRHFTPDSFHQMNQRRRLMDSAVPTLFLPILTSVSSEMGVNHTVPVPVLELHAHDLNANTSANQTRIPSDITVPVPDHYAHDLDASTSIEQVHNTITEDPIPSTSQQQFNLLQTPTRKRTLDPDSPSSYDCPVKKRLCRRILELKNVVKEKNIRLRKLRDANRKLKRRIISLKSLELTRKKIN